MIVLSALCTVASAQDKVKGLIIQTTTESTEVALSNIQSIRYNDTDMLFALRDGSEVSIPVSDISVITFGQVSLPTLITELLGTDSGKVTITDIQGRMVWQGNISNCPTLLRGLYVIGNGKTSRKVILK